MKALAIAIAVICLAIGPAAAQSSAHDAPAKAKNPGMVCLWTNRIDHTTQVNASTLLFYMKDGKVWRNTLMGPCPNLKTFGFAYVTRDGRICSNSQVIYVLRTQQVCALGNFEPYTPEPKKK